MENPRRRSDLQFGRLKDRIRARRTPRMRYLAEAVPVHLTCDKIGGLEGGRVADLRGLMVVWADLRTNPAVRWPGAVCPDGEDGLGRDGCADRALLPPRFAGHRAHRLGPRRRGTG